MERLKPAVDGLAFNQNLVQVESLIQVLVFMLEDISEMISASANSNTIPLEKEIDQRPLKKI